MLIPSQSGRFFIYDLIPGAKDFIPDIILF